MARRIIPGEVEEYYSILRRKKGTPGKNQRIYTSQLLMAGIVFKRSTPKWIHAITGSLYCTPKKKSMTGVRRKKRTIFTLLAPYTYFTNPRSHRYMSLSTEFKDKGD